MWTEYISKNDHRSAEWLESAYERAIEKARRWASEHYGSLRPGVREHVDMCFRIIELPMLREEAMNRLICIMERTPKSND